MLAIFFVSAGLEYAGVADAIGGRIHSLLGSRERSLILVLMLVAGVLSAFMNNVAATAVLLPAVASIARRSGLPPSRLFMPLAFGAILGGTTTLVGTPPNLLAAAALEEYDLEPFDLFDFTPLGVILLAVGMVFMATLGRRLLPIRGRNQKLKRPDDPAAAYRIQESLFSLRLPPGSPLEGLSLAEAGLGQTLQVQVVAVLRGGRKELAPRPDFVLREGDILLVEGQFSELKERLRMRGVEVYQPSPDDLAPVSNGISGITMRVPPSSPLQGQTLRELRFRERFGVMVVGIRREDRVLRQGLAEEPLREGDEILALGTHSQFEELVSQPGLEIREAGLPAVEHLEGGMFKIAVRPSSPLAGLTVGGSRMGELVGLTVVGILRGGETHLAVSPDEKVLPGDQLLVTGEPERVLKLLQLGQIEIESQAPGVPLESEEVGILEAVVAPRSEVAGKTLRELRFRELYGLQVLAIWREGEALRSGLADLPLRFGDALLLQGPRERMQILASDPDFLLLSQAVQTPRRTHKAGWALGALGLMIALVVTGWFPIQVAAFAAAVLTVLSGALTMEEAYRKIDWKAIFLVAAVLPVGAAMERTGAALLLADTVTSTAGVWGPYGFLAAIFLLSSLLSQGLDGAPTVVLLAPVVLHSAAQMEISPYPIMMGVSLAASAAFMTPFSHKANLLVMSAGGYRTADYLRVGTLLTILILGLLVLLVPVFFPLKPPV